MCCKICVRKTEKGNVCAKNDKKKYIVSDVQFSWAMVAEATEIETRSTLTKVFEKFIQHDSAA